MHKTKFSMSTLPGLTGEALERNGDAQTKEGMLDARALPRLLAA